tara:strand:+ start:2495 stop:5938 length:3444 start_codon:yes stop_codon:yes gene_type:complete
MATKFDPKYFDSFSANDHSERLLNLDALYEKLCERLVFAEESCIPQEIGSDDQDACCHMLEIIKKDIYDNCDSEETVHGPNDVDAHFSQMISLFLKVVRQMTPSCRDISAPIIIGGGTDSYIYAEDRAALVFFNCKFDVIFKNGWTLQKNGSILEGTALIKKCWNVLKNNILNIKEWKDLCSGQVTVMKNENQDKFTNFFKNGKLQTVLDDFTKKLAIVGNQLESYKDLLLLSYKSAVEQNAGAVGGTIDSNEACGLTTLLTMEDQQKDHVLFWARKVMLHMIHRNYKRLTRYAYVPPIDSASAACAGSQISENLGCAGIYEQIRMANKPQQVLFDLKRHEVIGNYEDFFDGPHARDNFFEMYPWLEDDPDRYTIAMRCKKPHFCKNPDGLLYKCNGICCDLMHTKIKMGDEKYKYGSGRWRNVDNVDISKSGHCKHCFEPDFQLKYAEEPKLTRGYKRISTLDDFIDNYFSIQNDVDAVVAHLRESHLVNRIKDYFLKTRLPDILELQPKEHTYMFADGYLVAEHKLVDVPTFYGFDSPEFSDGGKFCHVDVLNVYTSEVFRTESYDMQISEATKKNEILSDDDDSLILCNVCGCPRHICEEFQTENEEMNTYTLSALNDYIKESGLTHDLRRLYEKYLAMYHTIYEDEDIFYDFIRSSNKYFLAKEFRREQQIHRFLKDNFVRKDLSISKHNFKGYVPISRILSKDFTDSLDLGVLDDLVIYQYDWPQPWRELPASLHVQDADGRYWKEETRRMRQEVLFQWGRLYYRKGEFLNNKEMSDKTQNMLGTVGVGNTGKSTALNMVKRGMIQKDVAVLDCSTFEQQFGLSQILDSTFVAINEVETDSKTLTAGLIKQLCDESLMSAPQKNKDVKLAKMLAHIWFLGNEKLFSSDPSGALGRRIAQMHWLREVPRKNIDTQLETKYKLTFGHTLACLHLVYWRVMEKFADVDFWYKESTTFPHMSWMWHHLRSEGESITSKLTGVIKKFLKEKHVARFSPVHDVHQFRLPVVDQNDELDEHNNPTWFDDSGNYRLPVLYCPFQDMHKDSGKEGEGFKTKHISKLKDLYGRIVKQSDQNWSRGYDFFGRSFEQNGLLLLESKPMPWPITGDENGNHPCITSDWIVGMSFNDLFDKDNAQEWGLLQSAPKR